MKLPRTLSNWISMTGFVIAINSGILILVLFIVSLLSRHANIYNGLFAYIILPVILVIGLILIPIGMLIKKRALRKGESRWPVLDLNQPKARRNLVTVALLIFLFLIVSAVGSYEAFNYTESVEFCGKLCHKVMEPEYTTYLHSPHARVACVQCHVGEGADWYVKSKLSGLYQVYSVIFHKYSQPIPTPIHNLRPARETCERCHWPQKFYSRTLRSQKGYLTDSLNTEWNISLVMKIGPELSPLGLKEGIHWHINPNVKVEYAASTRDRETIPWIRLTDLTTGKTKVFQDTENMLTQKALDTLEIRTMDCMDCHNRPSHSFQSALKYVDNGMVTGEIPKDLPYVKKIAMNVLKGPFTNKDSSLMYIRDSITSFYRQGFPSLYASQKPAVDKAIAGIESGFLENVFPYMRVTSSSYLNHIGHLESNGCFRCHSGRHKSTDGQTITRDCNLCHSIIAQGPTGKVKYAGLDQSMEFMHPIDVKDNWKTYLCTECHRVLYP